VLVPDINATVGSEFSTPGIILAIVEALPALIVTEEKAGLAGIDDAPPTGAPLIVESPVIAPPALNAIEEMPVRLS
jgi:hypothetical protein